MADCASRDCLSHHLMVSRSMTPPAVSGSIVLLEFRSPYLRFADRKYCTYWDDRGIRIFFPWFQGIRSLDGHVLLVDVISWWPFTLMGDLPSRQFHYRYCDADCRQCSPCYCGCSAPSISSGSSSWTSTWYSSSNVSWYVASPIHPRHNQGSCRRRSDRRRCRLFHFLLRYWFRLFRFWLVL